MTILATFDYNAMNIQDTLQIVDQPLIDCRVGPVEVPDLFGFDLCESIGNVACVKAGATRL